MYNVNLNCILIYIEYEFNCYYDIIITIFLETIKHLLTRRLHNVDSQLELVFKPI